MFSEMIQGLLNSGGHGAAMQRAAQLNNYAKNTSKIKYSTEYGKFA